MTHKNGSWSNQDSQFMRLIDEYFITMILEISIQVFPKQNEKLNKSCQFKICIKLAIFFMRVDTLHLKNNMKV